MNSIKTQGRLPCLPTALALGLAACFAAPATFAQAANTAAAVAAPQTVAVTALRTPEKISDTVAEVTVITREQLDQYVGLSLSQVLARQPGVQYASNGGLGQTSSLYIRGLDSRSTVLLLDGVRIGSATIGTPSLDNLPLAMVDHIEIVRGPLSSIYGSDAVGGVVQVFTRRPRQGLTYGGEATAGSRGYQQEKAGVAYANGSVDAALDIQHTGTRGFSATNAKSFYYDPDRDGFKQDSVSARLGWQITNSWRLETATLDSAGLVHYDEQAGIDSHASLINRVQSLKLSGKILDGWQTEFAASSATDVDDVLESAYGLSTYETTEHDFSWTNRFATPIGQLMTVLDARNQDIGKSDTGFGNFARTKRDIYGIGLVLDGHAHGVTWQASARHDKNSQFGGINTGALALGYDLTPQWSVGASLGNSFVAPSFDDLYYPGYANPLLKPERGHTTEINTRWVSGDSEARLSVYRSTVHDLIVAGVASEVNVGYAKIPGVSLSGQTRWNALVLQGSFDHINPLNESSSVSVPLQRRAKNTVSANATWELGEKDDVGASFNAASSRKDSPYSNVVLGGYGLVDLFAEHKVARDWSVSARLNNVTSKVYETAYGYNQPRREFFLTLRYSPK